MNVKFYNLAKRNNSTKRPGGDGLSKDIKLKDATSVMSPVFFVQGFNPVSYNYVYVTDWNRYYFITDVKQVENMWEIACIEDVLATYKNEIGQSPAMVMYATGSTKRIVDSRIPVKADFVRSYTHTKIYDDLGTTEVLFPNAYCAVIGVTGVGSMGQFLLDSPLYVKELLDGVDNWKASNLTDMLSVGQQLFYGGSAAQCLKSAIGLPWVVNPTILGNSENIYLGSYPCKFSDGTPINGRYIKVGTFKYSQDISIQWTYTDWLTVSQYTTISLFLPMVGMISLPATDLMKDNAVTVTYSVNPTTGGFAVKVVGKTSGTCVYTGGGSCAFELPFGATGYNMDKFTGGAAAGIGTAVATAATAAATGGASIAAELALGGAMAAVVGGTMHALAGTGGGSAGGGGSASLGLGTEIECWVTQKVLTDEQSNLDNIIGKPFMGKTLIGNFSGFVQTDGFEFDNIRAYSAEKDKVNSLCNAGIYFE